MGAEKPTPSARPAPEEIARLERHEGVPRGAFALVIDALEFDHVEGEGRKRRLHHSARALSDDVACFSAAKFGLCAPAVLAILGIQTYEDLGLIVYAMIEVDLLHSSARDKPADFVRLGASYPWTFVAMVELTARNVLPKLVDEALATAAAA